MAASQHLVSRFAQVSPGFAYQPTEKHDGYALKFPHETLLSPPPRPPSVRRPVNSPSHPLITNHDLPPEMCFLFRPPFKKHLHTYPLLKVVVESFSRALCSCHRTRILWPTDDHFEAPDGDYPDQMHAYYINVLVSPVLNLLSQLRSPFIEEPLQLIVERLDDGVTSVRVTSAYPPIPRARSRDASTPVFLFTMPGFLEQYPEMKSLSESSIIHPLLRNAWETNAKSKIILTDLTSFHIFHPPSPSSEDRRVVPYERITLDDALLSIRVLIGAYIYDALPSQASCRRPVRGYLDPQSSLGVGISGREEPPLYEGMYSDMSGCTPNPNEPKPSDKEVFETRKRHSDFDAYTLMHDRGQELQFLRWKTHMEENADQIRNIRPGNVLSASTDGFARDNATLLPYWPIDLGTIPDSTMQFFNTIKRPPPLEDRMRHRLETSQTFQLSISDSLGGDCGTVHRCQLLSIDGEEVPPGLPDLCIKLFDDRLFDVRPSEDWDTGEDRVFWESFTTSEDDARRERVVYEQLRFAQGSFIPWYYGVHKFVLPDGQWVYGILLELISGNPMRLKEAMPSMSDPERMELIQGARHAVRALQYTDISTGAWARRKRPMLVLRSPVPHVVFFDFSDSSPSTSGNVVNSITTEYLEMFYRLRRTIMDLGRTLGEAVKFILPHYGGMEVWDHIIDASDFRDGGESYSLRAQDPFAWIAGTIYDDGQEEVVIDGVRTGLYKSKRGGG